MSISDKARKALLELGLTHYEIKVYTSLVNHGYLTASEISQIANVPFSKVYDVLASLQNKGFVRVEETRPAKYYPVEPKVAFDQHLKNISSKIKQNVDIAVSELNNLYEKKGLKEKSNVWLIRGFGEIIARIRDMVLKTKYEIFISLPIFHKEFESLLSLFLSLKLKNVKSYILVSKDIPKTFLDFIKEYGEIKYAGKMFGGGIIIDSKEVILLLPEEKNEAVALWSDHEGLANFAKNYFMHLWETSQSIH
jgi:sugar-specific transcriptional regulator TrmB